MRTSERSGEREHFETQQEQRQELVQEWVPPENPARRRLIIGGLLTGTALVAGVGGYLAVLPKARVEPRPVATTIAVHPASTPTAGHVAPAVMFGFDAQHTGFNPSETLLSPANVARLQIAWLSQPIGINYFSSPMVSGGLVYVGTASGYLQALDTVTGQIRWAAGAKSAANRGNFSTPAVVNGMVYICLQDAMLYAFDAVTGQRRWVSPAGNGVKSSPTVVNGVVYVVGNETVCAFDAVNGNLRWSSPLGGPTGTVAVANNLVYVTVASYSASIGRVYALNAASGQTRWISDLIENGIDDNSSPTVANGLVYIGSGDGGLAAFDAATGQSRWVTARTAGSTGSSPAVAQGRVYLAENRVYAFDASSGKRLWASDFIGASNSDSPFIANGVIYVCSIGSDGIYKGSVYALDAATGRTLWVSPRTNGQIFTTPIVAHGVLYVASGDKDGKVYAFRLPASSARS